MKLAMETKDHFQSARSLLVLRHDLLSSGQTFERQLCVGQAFAEAMRNAA